MKLVNTNLNRMHKKRQQRINYHFFVSAVVQLLTNKNEKQVKIIMYDFSRISIFYHEILCIMSNE